MKNYLVRLSLLVLLLAIASTPAFAQATSASSLTGTVRDTDGGAIPGATVLVTNAATGVTNETLSNSSGQFSFPVLDRGTYSVTVTLIGFKTFVASDVRLISSRPSALTVNLDVGGISETVEVRANATLVQSQTATVSSTLTTEQLTELPLVSRNALYALTTLPGISTTGGPRGALINGLPNNTVNITIDGIGTGNALQSTDGFFSMVTPRMDAVEEVTVTGAVPGVGAGAGSTQIAFVTRSGSNTFDSSVYLYWRDPKFNTNYFFNAVNNLPKNEVKVYQYGGRVGGPLVLPGYNGRGKAFFFFNMEHQRQPSSATRTRNVLKDSAIAGIFTYDRVVGGVTTQQTVNLLALAAAQGQVSTPDPTVMSILSRIKAATATVGTINETTARNVNQYVFQPTRESDQYTPTLRLDYNLTENNRISATYYWQRFKSNPDLLNNVEARFPGFANFGTQNSYRTTGSIGLRSTLTSNMVNELRGGWQWSPNDFFSNITPSMFDDQGGHSIGFTAIDGSTITSATARVGAAPRNTTTWSVSDNLSWLKGNHSLAFGASLAGVHNRSSPYDNVSTVDLGFDTNNDPAAGLFSTANFPGASSANLTSARNLYALLTGRVTSVNGTARLDASTGKYVYLGELTQKAKQFSIAAYASDSWRVSPTLTFSGGVRWDLQLPFSAVTPTFSTATFADLCGISGVGSGPDGRVCNLFQPGNVSGKAVPQYQQYSPGSRAYNTNYADFGFNAGFAWRPHVEGGWMRTILGNPEQATIRVGYSRTFNHERIDRFTGSIGANPGGTLNANRNATTGFCLVCPGEAWPLLYSETSRLGAPAFPDAPNYPIDGSAAQTIQLFQPNLRTPRVQSFSAGFQRSIGDNMALEVRYVGNKNQYGWAEEAWNERVIFENGFYDEFLLAKANLKANIAAGRGNTFAYTGAAGTSPLPIHQAYLSGRSGADSGNPSLYTSTSYANSAFLARLSDFQPNIIGAASALDTTANRVRALTAGLPANFFVLNPSASSAQVVTDREGTRYGSLQVELRRRLSKGLLIGANYTYGIRKSLINRSIRLDRMEVDSTGVPHEFKVNWTYELPVGRGRRFGTDMHSLLNGILGNWEFSGNARFQTSRFQLRDVKLVGMSVKELQKEFKVRVYTDTATGTTTVYSMSQAIIDNTRRAFSTDPTSPTGYSSLGVPSGRYIKPSSDANCLAIYRQDCTAPDININGPVFVRVDLRAKKLFPFLGHGSLEVDVEMLNAFNNVNFNHQLTPGDTANAFRITSAYTDTNTTFDPGGRIGQLVFRINW